MGIVAMKTITGESWMAGEQKAVNNPKASLKWVLQDENVHTAIPGFTTFDQMELDLSVMEDLTLTQAELDDLRLEPSLGDAGLFCPQCGDCVTQCGNSVDIPTLMRAYMYVYGYRNLGAAKDAVMSVVSDADVPCVGCNTCTVTCASGYDVRGRLLDIARLSSVPFDFLV